jgi:hypothetical protein
MTYVEQSIAISQLVPVVRRALFIMGFELRAGTADQIALYNAIFSNTTKFTAHEATQLAWFFSWGDNDLRVLGATATDAQVQLCVNAIQDELITRQAQRISVTGLQ